MFNDDDPLSFKKMHEFSTVDGFVEITEGLSDMIKYVANEPSVGLFYVQKHTHNATPNLINLKKNVVEKSHDTSLHTEDLEDSITMVQSMKECGVPIANEMIGEIKKSLSILSAKNPKKGLIYSSGSGFLGRNSFWSPATWGRKTFSSDDEKNDGYFSGVFKSAKQRAAATNFKSNESSQSLFENPSVFSETEGEDLSMSSELQENSQLSKSLSHQQLISMSANFDEFKADREAKFEEWLGGTGNGERSDERDCEKGM